MYCTASFALVSDRAKLKKIGGFLMMGLLNPRRYLIIFTFQINLQPEFGIWQLHLPDNRKLSQTYP